MFTLQMTSFLSSSFQVPLGPFFLIPMWPRPSSHLQTPSLNTYGVWTPWVQLVTVPDPLTQGLDHPFSY